MRVSSYAKTILAGVVAVIGAVSPLVADGFYTTEDVVQTALFILTAFGVYAVPNTPDNHTLDLD